MASLSLSSLSLPPLSPLSSLFFFKLGSGVAILAFSWLIVAQFADFTSLCFTLITLSPRDARGMPCLTLKCYAVRHLHSIPFARDAYAVHLIIFGTFQWCTEVANICHSFFLNSSPSLGEKSVPWKFCFGRMFWLWTSSWEDLGLFILVCFFFFYSSRLGETHSKEYNWFLEGQEKRRVVVLVYGV